MNEFENKKDHSFTVKNRECAALDGVTDVDAFNEEEIQAKTDYGALTIKGEKLHIEELDLSCGKLKVNGKITALIYVNDGSKKSTFRRLFS